MQDKDQHPRIKRLKFTTDQGAGARARIGLLVLQSDQTVEAEFRQLTNLPGVAVYHARLANDTLVTPETLAKMEAELPIAAGLLPDFLGLNSLGYGCTSGATIIGEDRVADILNTLHPGVSSTNPLTAAKAALKQLGVKRLGLLTPYSPDVTDAMRACFNDDGIAVTLIGSFYEENDIVVGRIDRQSILEATIALGRSDDCDGVFISCTSLRTADIIEEAEHVLGKPVTSSNHALAWHLLRLAGVEDNLDVYGRLFRSGHPIEGR
ncbi:MAG: maleate isomerase [Paracoccaceae bacterium]|jgi:maleate isomerase